MSEERLCVPNSYYITVSDLYRNFNNYKYLEGSIKDWKWGDYKYVFGQMLRYLFWLIIQDVINNSVTFKMPDSGATIEMVPVTGEDFVRARQNGAFQDIDFLATNFTGYNLCLVCRNRYRTWKKVLYVSQHIKQLMIDRINSGLRY